MTPEQLAEVILRAAGSGLRHYTPQSRERIIEAARQAIEGIRAGTLRETAT